MENVVAQHTVGRNIGAKLVYGTAAGRNRYVLGIEILAINVQLVELGAVENATAQLTARLTTGVEADYGTVAVNSLLAQVTVLGTINA